MADENTQTETADESKAAKAPTVAADMDARRIFPDTATALEYINASAARFADWNETTVAAPGVGADEEGHVTFDPAIYTPDMDVMVAVLRKQGQGVKAVVVAPVPKVNVLLESDAGKAWVSARFSTRN
jgi:hypothetical protein